MEIQKRRRSPSVPVIGLAKSTCRSRELYIRVGRDPLSPEDMAAIWGLAPTSSGASRTTAALRAYGLIEKSGGKHQMRISDLAAEILNPGPEAEAVQRAWAAAALKPELIAQYAARWRGGRPPDEVCIAQLQNLHRFTTPAAAAFLPVFDEGMWFAGGGVSGVFPAVSDPPSFSSDINIGDYVQMPSDGADDSRRRVVWLADGGRYLYLEGSLAKCPAGAVTRLNVSPPPVPARGVNVPISIGTPESEAKPDERPLFPRIQLSVAVDRTYDLVGAVGRDWMSIIDAAVLWGKKPDIRSVMRIAAGLCDYGFAEQSGQGKSRKLRVTELGWRAVVGTRETCKAAISEAVSKPSLITHYAAKWKGRRPPTGLAVDEVMREQRLPHKRASLFVVLFDQCIPFIKLETADAPTPATRTECEPPPSPVLVENRLCSHPDMPVSESSPVFVESRRVVRPGISQSDPSAVRVEPHAVPPLVMPPAHENVLKIEQHGDRIKISARLDVAGVKQLKEVLPHYETILELLVPAQQPPVEASESSSEQL